MASRATIICGTRKNFGAGGELDAESMGLIFLFTGRQTEKIKTLKTKPKNNGYTLGCLIGDRVQAQDRRA